MNFGFYIFGLILIIFLIGFLSMIIDAISPNIEKPRWLISDEDYSGEK